jgi:hypothetical protein
MWAKGCRLPTQAADGRAVCFCGAAIGIADMDEHDFTAHMEQVNLSKDSRTVRGLSQPRQ